MLNSEQVKTEDPIRVMVVDDSAVIRGLMARMLADEPDIRITASVGNGELAVKSLNREIVDIIILDIEMPVMDGLTALPKLLEIDHDIKIIMASTLTMRNAEISIRALSAGATEYIPKPSSSRDMGGSSDFKRELISKIKSLGEIRRRRAGRTAPKALAPSPGARKPFHPAGAPSSAKPKPATSGWHRATQADVVLRKPGLSKPDVLAVGSSTGGPQALFDFFKSLDKSLKLPIVITQHMPATFTTILAEHITRMSGWPCSEAKNGDVLTPGQILLAPGNYHMTVVNKGAQRVVSLNQDAPENFCRPAVDPMLRSLVQVYGPRVLAVILTGMGNDGEKGSAMVVEKGGTVISQDEKTSVVWGMPGAVASAGLCSAVLPLQELAQYVSRFVTRTPN